MLIQTRPDKRQKFRLGMNVFARQQQFLKNKSGGIQDCGNLLSGGPPGIAVANKQPFAGDSSVFQQLRQFANGSAPDPDIPRPDGMQSAAGTGDILSGIFR